MSEVLFYALLAGLGVPPSGEGWMELLYLVCGFGLGLCFAGLLILWRGPRN